MPDSFTLVITTFPNERKEASDFATLATVDILKGFSEQ